jgi:hypothetical protein
VDTEARLGSADFEALAKGCGLLVISTVPASLDTDVVILTLEACPEAGSRHEGLDLSGLVQNLLEGWIKRQKS